MAEPQYSQVGIDKLNLSVRSYNCLRRAKIDTIQALLDVYNQGKLIEIRNLGIKSFDEIVEAIRSLPCDGFPENVEINEQMESEQIEELRFEEYVVPDELENIPITDLELHVRLYNGLIRGGFNTVGKVLRMTEDDVLSLRGLGVKSLEELHIVVSSVKEKGVDYFKLDPDINSPKSIDEKHKRSIDIDTVNLLKEEYGFKPVWLLSWYGVTRSRIQQILSKRRNPGNWLNRTMTENDKELIVELLNHKREYVESSEKKAYFLNNGKDNCAVIIVSEEEIKCFFKADLPEELRAEIVGKRLDCLSFEEIEIANSGWHFTVLKTAFFCPEAAVKFRGYANARGMSVEEYSLFLTGAHYATGQITVTDDKIVEFLDAHYTNGRLLIPSNNSTHWFRSFISRNGYSIEEIADLYGYGENDHYTDDVERFGAVEDDMQSYEVDSDEWIDSIYAENPLVGNKLLSERVLSDLYTTTKKYIDARLLNPTKKFTITEKKEIALAVISFAKDWDTGDESGFWKYITAQFGYRDETSTLRNVLCDCVFEAMAKSKRWYVLSASGYQYKSTIVAHALTTKRSWMLLYDFLFDFYKTNMEWTYIEEDPIVPRMVTALRSKLIAGDEADNDNLEISTKVYYFQEGIRKLIIYRTGYAITLIDHMLRRIDGIINHSEQPTELYVDVLCDQWIEGKLKNARETRTRGSVAARSVAIDYSRIRPRYVLRNEKDVFISFPDIRLKKMEFRRVELIVYVGDVQVEDKTLSFYGNELGKTLSSFDVDLNNCLRRGDGSLKIRIIIKCDDEEIYDSGESLYRDLLCFERETETSAQDCKKGSYSFFTTMPQSFEFIGSEVSEIDAETVWKAYYVVLGQGFLVKHGGKILAFDNSEGELVSSGVRVVAPSTDTGIAFLKNGRKYALTGKESSILVIAPNREALRKCAISLNSKKLELGSLTAEETANGLAYSVPLQPNGEGICEFQVVDLEKNRIISRSAIKYLPKYSVKFDRDYYYSEKDYENATAAILTSDGIKKIRINANDEIITAPIEDGSLEIRLPKIVLRDHEGQKWKNGYTAWVKDIEQGEKVFISAPAGCTYELLLGDLAVTEDIRGSFDFGNAVFSCQESDTSDWIDLKLCVAGGRTSDEYLIGRITKREQFKSSVQFDYHDNTLFWNRGLGFVGNSRGSFMLRLETKEGKCEYPLDLDDEVIKENPQLPTAEYKYQIVKESENIFLGDETVLASGTLLIGDKNELRFADSIISLSNITYEENEDIRSVEIKNTYVDQIEYQGIQFVDSEDRECPVYKGIMFFMGQSGKHHEFSYDDCVSEKGFQLYKINPVKIVYINEHTLSITTEDDDGIYYYRYLDKTAMANRYAITDREPTKQTERNYYLADLYTYKKERMK